MDKSDVSLLKNDELLAATRALAVRSCQVEAELLVHLGEVDARKLYLAHSCTSMHVFCTRELGFSEGAAYNRIFVARAGRRFPALIEALRTGRVHLAGLRLLAPHLTDDNCEELLTRAAGRTREQIAMIVAGIAPWASPCTSIWRLPGSALVPAAEDAWDLILRIPGEFRGEIRELQDLLRHQVPDGDLLTVFRMAVHDLVLRLKKKRFAVGRKPRKTAEPGGTTESRHVPDAIKRAVYERDGGQCTFVDERGIRCGETGALEYDHVDGFARTHRHDVGAIRLLCRAHNQYVADQMYGRAFMDAARTGTCPGTSSGEPPS